MTRANGKWHRTFAMIPVDVLHSPACTTLPHYAFRLLLLIAGQYRGKNNGDLAMTWGMAQGGGIRSKEHLSKGLALLIARGLIVKTRQGGIGGFGARRKPTLYAVSWKPIDPCDGKLEVPPTQAPSEAWRNWDTPASAPPGGHGPASAPPAGRGGTQSQRRDPDYH